MIKRYIIILLMLMPATWVMAQDRPPTFRLWQLTSYSGIVGVTGFYREQVRTLNNIVDYSKSPFINGNFLLNTKSYIGHPNLLLLEVGGEYNPGSSQQFYTVSPDRSEALTFSRLNLGATLFSGKPMSLGANFNIGRNYINREYVSSTRTDNRQWGLNYNYRNKILPLAVTYTDRRWDQLELETNRLYKNKQTDLQARVNRSFTKYGDTNELRYVYYTFYRKDPNLTEVNTTNSNIFLNNTLYLDEKRRYMFKSNINNLVQTGNLTQNRFQLLETVNLSLPFKLLFNANYNYFNIQQETQDSKQQRIHVGLDHELFTSLRTSVFYEAYGINHTAFKENNTRYGISFNYIKKIPTGTLNLAYSYRTHNQEVLSNPNSIIQVFDEPHVLADGEVVLLDRPYVDLATIVVKDPTGAIIFQRDFDYIVIEHTSFVEIQRVLGGQIPNNAPVLVDYSATQVGAYNFEASSQSFTVRLNLLDQLLELYYTTAIQDYTNVEATDFLTLNYYTRNIYGGAVNVWLLTAGAEWDDYNSTIVPYKKMRYYLRINGKVGKKALFSINSDLTDLTLTETNTEQLYSSVYGKVVYMFKPQNKLDFDIGYRKQVGEQIDLDLINAKLEYNTVYRNLYMKVGLEVFKRNYVGETLNFKGIYFKVERKF